MNFDFEPPDSAAEYLKPSPTRFTVRQLFWLSLLVALLLTMADRVGMWRHLHTALLTLKTTNLVTEATFLVLALLMLAGTLGLLIWIVFRAPYLWSSYRFEQRLRAKRIASLKRQYLDRGELAADQRNDAADYQDSESI